MSVVDEQTETFVYHDWPEMIGASAATFFADAFEYREGAIAWVDSGSNLKSAALDVVLRLNIALFSLADSGRRVIVEVHQEKMKSI